MNTSAQLERLGFFAHSFFVEKIETHIFQKLQKYVGASKKKWSWDFLYPFRFIIPWSVVFSARSEQSNLSDLADLFHKNP